jgi:hypothetical protein
MSRILRQLEHVPDKEEAGAACPDLLRELGHLLQHVTKLVVGYHDATTGASVLQNNTGIAMRKIDLRDFFL